MEVADARTLAAWHALANQVAAALRRAGLPVTGPATDVTNGRTGRKYGAFVEVDPIADGAGGVFTVEDAATVNDLRPLEIHVRSSELDPR